MTHKDPNRLKRPLKFADRLTGLHFAVRQYEVCEHNQSGLTVYRTATPDIDLLNLFGDTNLGPEPLLDHFQQWRSDAGNISVLPVQGRGLVFFAQ